MTDSDLAAAATRWPKLCMASCLPLAPALEVMTPARALNSIRVLCCTQSTDTRSNRWPIAQCRSLWPRRRPKAAVPRPAHRGRRRYRSQHRAPRRCGSRAAMGRGDRVGDRRRARSIDRSFAVQPPRPSGAWHKPRGARVDIIPQCIHNTVAFVELRLERIL